MSLDDIRARAKAATEGPWVEYHENGKPCQYEAFNCAPATGAFLVQYGVDLNQQSKDAEFIAHARTDIPKLLAALDAALSVHVEGTFQRLDPQQECKHCRYAWPCVTVRAITEALR